MRALFKVAFSMLLLAFLLIGLSFSVLRAQGTSGPVSPGGRLVATEKRPLAASILNVDLSGPINLTLRQGPVASLEVRGEQRLLANVDTTADGDTLHIGPRGILLRHRQPIEVMLVLPMLDSLNVNGTGEHTVSGFAGDKIELMVNGSAGLRFNGRYREVEAGLHGSGEVEITGGSADRVTANLLGSGAMTLVGASRELQAEMSGSGSLDARHLRADVVNLGHHGSGATTVYARKNVHVELSGSGEAVVYGNPAQQEVTRNGSGGVSFRD